MEGLFRFIMITSTELDTNRVGYMICMIYNDIYIYIIMGKKCGNANNQSSPIEAYCRVYLYLG